MRTCLAKDPDERWQSAGDVARELKWIAEGSATGRRSSRPMSRRQRPRERLAWAVAAVAILFGATSAFLSRRPQAPEELVRFTIMPPSGQGFLGFVKLSPDARRLLFLLQDEGGRTSIAMRSLDSLEMRRLPGTEDARGMFWSPDGREIAFFSEGKLRRIGADGGPVQTICESGGGFSGAWSRRGTILFTKEFGGPIVAVPAAGGTPDPVTALDPARGDVAHFHPAFLPDGRHFVFVARNLDPEKTSIVLASLDSKDVRRLFHADSAAVFADPGYLLFARDNALFAWRFDPEPEAGRGPGSRVRAGPLRDRGQLPVGLGGREPRGVLVVVPAAEARLGGSQGARARHARRNRRIRGRSHLAGRPKVAVALRDPEHGQNLDVWVLDASRGTGSRITSERTDEFDPAWFPDGERLVYVSDHVGFYDLFERPAIGGTEKILVRTKQDKVLPTVSPDGRHLLVSIPEGDHYARVLTPLPDGVIPAIERRLPVLRRASRDLTGRSLDRVRLE